MYPALLARKRTCLCLHMLQLHLTFTLQIRATGVALIVQGKSHLFMDTHKQIPGLLPGSKADCNFTLGTTWCSTYVPCYTAPFPLSIKQLCLAVDALVTQPVLCFQCLSSGRAAGLVPSGFERTDHTQTQSRENPQYLGVQWDCGHVTCGVPHLGSRV